MPSEQKASAMRSGEQIRWLKILEEQNKELLLEELYGLNQHTSCLALLSEEPNLDLIERNGDFWRFDTGYIITLMPDKIALYFFKKSTQTLCQLNIHNKACLQIGDAEYESTKALLQQATELSHQIFF